MCSGCTVRSDAQCKWHSNTWHWWVDTHQLSSQILKNCSAMPMSGNSSIPSLAKVRLTLKVYYVYTLPQQGVRNAHEFLIHTSNT